MVSLKMDVLFLFRRLRVLWSYFEQRDLIVKLNSFCRKMAPQMTTNESSVIKFKSNVPNNKTITVS